MAGEESTPVAGEESTLVKLLMSIVEKGTPPVLIKALNVVSVALLLTLVGTIIIGFGDIHVYIMLGLALGLIASVNWFMHELSKTQFAAPQAEPKKEE